MDIEKVKRYSLMEVVLLAVFVFGLLIAHAIVKIRGTVTLSAPIELPHSGLQVSIPTNPGWGQVHMWQYESDNSLALIATRDHARQGGMRISDVEVQWHYHICTPNGSVKDLLYARAERDNALLERIEVVGQTSPMHYAKLSSADGSGNQYFVGIIKLDFGRSLELQILPHNVDLIYAENIFHALASSIQYEKPQQLAGGKELLDQFWKQYDTGLNNNSITSGNEEAFLVKDINNNTTGFFYRQSTATSGDEQGRLQIQSRQHQVNRLSIDSTLRIDRNSETLTWKTSVQRIGMGTPREYILSQDKDGMIDLKRNYDKDKQYSSDGLLLPELLLSDYLSLFLSSDQQAVLIDVLTPTGQVVPTHISVIDIDKASAKSENTEIVVKVDYMHHPNSYDEFFYDKEKQPIGRFERQPAQGVRLWEPTTPAKLELLFGDFFKRAGQEMAVVEQDKISF